MTRKFLKEYQDGDQVDDVFLLAEKQLRANRNADLYLLASLRDRTGVISGLMWNVTEDGTANFTSGDFVHVRGKVQLYQGGLQMILTSVRPVPADGLNLADFHPEAGRDVERLLGMLRERLLSVADPGLRVLLECFLIDESLMRDLARAPAGIKAHHAYHGGLLEHIVTMLEVAHRIIDLYPDLNGDLLMAGIFLHDLGKIREMSYDVTFSYTDEGQLLGHMSIAVELLTEKLQQVAELQGEALPDETVWRLKHMILSHHGAHEFGSPKLPMTPEAVALHYLDNLDAKLYEFTRSILDDPNAQSNWTPYSPRLERKLFKGASTQ